MCVQVPVGPDRVVSLLELELLEAVRHLWWVLGHRLSSTALEIPILVFLCSPGWLRAHNPPSSASRVMALQACHTTPGFYVSFLKH